VSGMEVQACAIFAAYDCVVSLSLRYSLSLTLEVERRCVLDVIEETPGGRDNEVGTLFELRCLRGVIFGSSDD